MDFVTVASLEDLQPGGLACVDVDGIPITIANADGTVYAFAAYCSHQRALLEEGELEGTTILCPWHATNFDITTGAVLAPPATEPIATYPVRVVGSEIQVDRHAVRDSAN